MALPPGFLRDARTGNLAWPGLPPPAAAAGTGAARLGAGESARVFKAVLEACGLRSGLVSSPRPGVNVFCDGRDCPAAGTAAWLGWAMLGLQEDAAGSEASFEASGLRRDLTLLRFLKICETALGNARGDVSAARRVLQGARDEALAGTRDAGAAAELLQRALAAASSAGGVEAALLERELSTVSAGTASLATALLQLFLEKSGLHVHEAFLRGGSAFKRVTITFHDPEADHRLPKRLALAPRVAELLRRGPRPVAERCLQRFWQEMLQLGYLPQVALRSHVSERLQRFFLSGVSGAREDMLPLGSGFAPRAPLALYLHGIAGCGKSAFVQRFPAALSAALEENVDRELVVRFVKLNLNKPLAQLDAELTAKANNNDLSVMSVIEQRRQTLSQAKPGLVVVALEEVPEDTSGDGAAQLSQRTHLGLVAERFRRIAGDASILFLLTSNYGLCDASRQQLARLPCFSALQPLLVAPLDREERTLFAEAFFRAQLPRGAALGAFRPRLPREGDLRPVVRKLRVLAGWARHLCGADAAEVCVTPELERSAESKTPVSDALRVAAGAAHVVLEERAHHNLVPSRGERRGAEGAAVLGRLRRRCGGDAQRFEGLQAVLDDFFAGAIAPCVVLCASKEDAGAVADAIEAEAAVEGIRGVDALRYRMARTLYDKQGAPNLRDDILRLKGCSSAFEASRGAAEVCVEVHASCREAQLCIREMAEDTPSMTAFSSKRSVLRKDGIVFVISCATPITPELLSRASYVVAPRGAAEPGPKRQRR